MGIFDFILKPKKNGEIVHTISVTAFEENASNFQQQEIYDFVAIDFETANSKHHICSVGIVAVKDAEIIKEKHWYVKPPTEHFDFFNVRSHGITYEKVKNEPSFIEIWEELKQYIIGQKLVAHNAKNSDFNILRKTVESLPIFDKIDYDNYACTLELSRLLFPDLDNHKLSTIAEYLNLGDFIHHNALEDAKMCAKAYLQMQNLDNYSEVIASKKNKKKANKGDYFKSIQSEADMNDVVFEKLENIESIFDKNIVVTGTFDSYERPVLELLIEKNGGNLKSSVNRKTDFIVVGNNPGPSKIQTAKALNIKLISEEDILKLLPKK